MIVKNKYIVNNNLSRNLKLTLTPFEKKEFRACFHILLFVLLYFLSIPGPIYGKDRINNVDEVELSPVFGSHMVLQQNQPINIWGTASTGAKIEAELDGEFRQTISNHEGKWLITFSSKKASLKPLTLKVNDLFFENILIGEVWLCSGQSNMQFPLKNINNFMSISQKTFNHSLRLLQHKNIRIVARDGYTKEELARCNKDDFFEAKWEVSNSENAMNSSAIGWLFGNDIQNKLNIPVGIIQISVGGSALNNWIPPKTLKSNPITANLFKTNWFENEEVNLAHRKRARDAFQNVLDSNQSFIVGKSPYRWVCEPGFLFEAGIAPLQHLYFQGVVWYQGESDTDNLKKVCKAKKLLPVMINEWRSFFNNGDFPFILVQLPSYKKGVFWPEFRDIQQKTSENLNQTYMVSTIDLGEENDIHPKDKKPIASRAVRIALKNVYGYDYLLGFPKLEGWELNRQQITLKLKEYGAGVYSMNASISGFEVAKENGQFEKALSFISSQNTIKVLSPINNPTLLRYAWSPFHKSENTIYNSDHLPLAPFIINLQKPL